MSFRQCRQSGGQEAKSPKGQISVIYTKKIDPSACTKMRTFCSSKGTLKKVKGKLQTMERPKKKLKKKKNKTRGRHLQYTRLTEELYQTCIKSSSNSS